MKRNFYLLLFASIVLWVVQDILTWQRIFETDQLWQYDGIYHRGWYISLFGYMIIGSFFFLSHKQHRLAILFPATLYVLANSGLADILYYWLDGRTIPDTLPWLDVAHPFILIHPVTSANILVSPVIWFSLAVLLNSWQQAHGKLRSVYRQVAAGILVYLSPDAR